MLCFSSSSLLRFLQRRRNLLPFIYFLTRLVSFQFIPRGNVSVPQGLCDPLTFVVQDVSTPPHVPTFVSLTDFTYFSSKVGSRREDRPRRSTGGGRGGVVLSCPSETPSGSEPLLLFGISFRDIYTCNPLVEGVRGWRIGVILPT